MVFPVLNTGCDRQTQFFSVAFSVGLLWLEHNPFDVLHVEQRDVPPVDLWHGDVVLLTISASLLVEE